jgi:hypothetical protein
MKANTMEVSRPKFGLLQVGIVVLTMITAAIHLWLGISFSDTLFLLNGLGYLVLLAGLFLPLSFTQGRRDLIRWALIGFTALTILAWLVMGEKTLPQATVGYVTKAVEIVLIILLLVDRRN